MIDKSPFPLSLDGVPAWAKEHNVSPELALRRFVYYAVLECVAADEQLADILIMRGASALWLFYNGVRPSPDVDFFAVSLNREAPPDFMTRTREQLNAALSRGLPGRFPDYEQRRSWLMKTIRVDLNLLSGVPCDCCPVWLSPASAYPVKVCTLEFILSEKFVAMVSDRNRKTREHDLLDLVSLFNANEQRMNVPRLAELVRRKSEAEGIPFQVSSYNDLLRAKLNEKYERLRVDAGDRFIPFDQAWDRLHVIVGMVQDATRK